MTFINRLPNAKYAGFEVHILPAQGEKLTYP